MCGLLQLHARIQTIIYLILGPEICSRGGSIYRPKRIWSGSYDTSVRGSSIMHTQILINNSLRAHA